jgi:hemerythrin-like domain-containing protein
MPPNSADPLDRRDGIPDTLAYLRASYPKPAWRAHANFGELSAFWLHVHDHLRTSGAELAKLTTAFREDQVDPATFQRAFVPRISQFLQHLNGHHQIEDHAYFPKFRALDARMVAGFDLLEADHHQIHEALLAAARSGQALLNALAQTRDAARTAADTYAEHADHLLALLVRHLADEEDLVLPAMLQYGERSVG